VIRSAETPAERTGAVETSLERAGVVGRIVGGSSASTSSRGNVAELEDKVIGLRRALVEANRVGRSPVTWRVVPRLSGAHTIVA
jgi:hypothetical protein